LGAARSAIAAAARSDSQRRGHRAQRCRDCKSPLHLLLLHEGCTAVLVRRHYEPCTRLAESYGFFASFVNCNRNFLHWLSLSRTLRGVRGTSDSIWLTTRLFHVTGGRCPWHRRSWCSSATPPKSSTRCIRSTAYGRPAT